MDHFQLRHAMNLRMPLELFMWLRRNAEGLPPSTYAIQRLSELAQQDLQGAVDGDVRAHAR